MGRELLSSYINRSDLLRSYQTNKHHAQISIQESRKEKHEGQLWQNFLQRNNSTIFYIQGDKILKRIPFPE